MENFDFNDPKQVFKHKPLNKAGYVKGYLRITKEMLNDQLWLKELIKDEFIVTSEKPLDENYKFTKAQLDQIRSMEDFDLTMFLSEVHDRGIETALTLLPMIEATCKKDKNV